MATMRHWKQRWTPGAKLVFRRRMVLGCCGVDVVEPGDPVTDEMLTFFGHRMRRWWDAGHIELAEWPLTPASKAPEAPEPVVVLGGPEESAPAAVVLTEPEPAPVKQPARKKKARKPAHG